MFTKQHSVFREVGRYTHRFSLRFRDSRTAKSPSASITIFLQVIFFKNSITASIDSLHRPMPTPKSMESAFSERFIRYSTSSKTKFLFLWNKLYDQENKTLSLWHIYLAIQHILNLINMMPQ